LALFAVQLIEQIKPSIPLDSVCSGFELIKSCITVEGYATLDLVSSFDQAIWQKMSELD
jgi:hypothetical protein